MLRMALTLTVLLVSSFSATAALYDRGNGMIYDDVLDITWLQDANYAQTSGYDADGMMAWEDAVSWADQLVYGGFSDWRLASMQLEPGNCQASSDPCVIDDTASELGHMLFNNLGHNFDEWTLGNTTFIDGDLGGEVSFLNIQRTYWLAEDYKGSPYEAWAFNYYAGVHGYDLREASGFASTNSAWAVRAGDVADVSAVPVPAAAWLFGSALIGLVGIKRKR